MRATLFILLLFSSSLLFGRGFDLTRAPETPPSPDFQFSTGNNGYYSSPVYFGGNFGYFPRKDGMLFSVAPIIGARVTRRFHIGLSAGIQYERENITIPEPYPDSTVYVYEQAAYDISIFARYFFHYRFFLHLEPEVINYKEATLSWDYVKNVAVETSERKNVFAGLAGIGFAAPIGRQSILVLTVLYDVVQDDAAPYGPYPFLRGGFNLGF